MTGVKVDPDRLNISDDAWEFVEATEDFVRHRAVVERFADGTVVHVYRTIPRGLTGFLEANKQAFDGSQGKRFGEWTNVGSIPLNVLYDPRTQLVDKIREGDHDHMKWFLQKSEAGRPYRRFRGTF